MVLLVLSALFIFSCGNDKDEEKMVNGYSFSGFSGMFKEADLPYELTDTLLKKNSDTTRITAGEFTELMPDSLQQKIFGKAKIKFTPLAKVTRVEAESYFIVKAASGNTKAAILFVYDVNGEPAGVFPFLIPDKDVLTTQLSSIEESYAISKHVHKKKGTEVFDGKDVYVFNNETKDFSLIMTDPLEGTTELINPIDTLPRTNKYAGDYGSDKNILISIRDGRTPNQLSAFVHIKKNNGKCTGELKGELFFTSSKTAAYRQSGDPCVLNFTFTSSSVILKEDEGCGNHRDIDCLFDGTYKKKKAPKPKSKP